MMLASSVPMDLLESDGRSRHRTLEQSHWASPRLRAVLVAKMRWIMLAILGIYGLFAAALLSYDSVPLFLTGPQLLFLLLATAVVASYNLVFQFRYEVVRNLRWVDHLQIVLDLMFVTVVIHFSGGGVSWFWPVYLLVTIEAAFLLPRQKDVWMVGAVGGASYGILWYRSSAGAGSVTQSGNTFSGGAGGTGGTGGTGTISATTGTAGATGDIRGLCEKVGNSCQ